MVGQGQGIVYNLAKCPQCERKYATVSMGMFKSLLWESRDLPGNELIAPMWAMEVSVPQDVLALDVMASMMGMVASPRILAACPKCDSGNVEVGVVEIGEPDWRNFQWPTVFIGQKSSLLEMFVSHAVPVEKGWLHLPPPPIPFRWGYNE